MPQRPLSAAEKLYRRKSATKRQRREALAAIQGGRAIRGRRRPESTTVTQPEADTTESMFERGLTVRQRREREAEILRDTKKYEKHSPGATVKVPGKGWPIGEGKIKATAPCDKNTGTEDRVNPTIR